MKVMSKLVSILVVSAVIIVAGLYPSANAQPDTSTPADGPIEFDDVPIDQVIQALARELGINYLVDPRLIKWWQLPIPDTGATHEPIVTFHGNMMPKEALDRILGEHHLVLLGNPQTGIARITYPGQGVQDISSNVYSFVAEPNQSDHQSRYPIAFTDVPITIALQALARKANIIYALDPQIGYGTPDKNGNIRMEPTLTYHWENVTPARVFFAICENYDLIAVKDPQTGVLLISEKNNPITNFIDASLLGADTNNFNPIQITGNSVWQGSACSDTNAIQIENVPFRLALDQLAGCVQLKIVFDSELPDVPPISLCWNEISVKKAIVTLCEIYDLAIAKNPATGEIHVGLKK